MVILGIDIGFASLGWALCEVKPDYFEPLACGVIRTEKANKKIQLRSSEDNIRRAQDLLSGLDLVTLVRKPQAIATESMSWPRSAGVVAKMGIAWGVLASFAYQHGLPMVQSSPMEVKRQFVGDGKASKERMIAWAKAEYPTLKLPTQETLHEHAVDAIAAVYACRTSEAFKWLFKAQP
jgi:crossover junction endodeoxyribonuclease RuvC